MEESPAHVKETDVVEAGTCDSVSWKDICMWTRVPVYRVPESLKERCRLDGEVMRIPLSASTFFLPVFGLF